jgi:ribosomal-protein-alanine N-acetyltransferase
MSGTSGIGTLLLQRMLEMLQAEGYRQVSLSVQKANYALRMYRKAGFRAVEDGEDELIMIYDLR